MLTTSENTPEIQIKFSEFVQNVNQETVTLHNGNPAGPVIATGNLVMSNDNTYSFYPASPLSDDSTYYIVLTSGITDHSGNALSPVSFSFATGDVTAPSVTMLTPSNNDPITDAVPEIQLQFSETMENVNPNMTVNIQDAAGNPIYISQISGDDGTNHTYTFSPTLALTDNTTYTVQLSSDITDLAGHPLPESNFSFITGDVTAPTVNMLVPNNNDTGVSTTPNIEIEFSEPVNNVDAAHVQLANNEGATVALEDFQNTEGNIWTFTPSQQLNEKTEYALSFSGITDQAGHLLSAGDLHFTTGEFTSPTVISVSPNDNDVGVSLNPTFTIAFSELVNDVNTTNVQLTSSDGSPVVSGS